MHEATRVVRAGLPAAVQGTPLLPGPTFAAVYHLAGDPATSPYGYGRYDNPGWTRYEAALADLEGGPAVVFASGMAAIVALMATILRPRDVIVMPTDGYYTARAIASGYFSEMGIVVRSAPTAGDAQAGLLTDAKLLWLESPTNPALDVCDLAALVAAGHQAGAMVAVDNTTATPLGQRPLDLGADFSVAADTKALTGHGDLVLGHVAAREAAAADRLKQWRSTTGAVLGPMEAWLAHRSLATLDVRFERMCANALAIAECLARHVAVRRVRYPGLPRDPAHAIAARQMRRFGPVVSFELEGREAAERFFNAARLVTEATSFGVVQTTAERRARWGGDPVPPGFIRLSAGLEHADDLVADIAQALDAARG